VNTRIAVYVAIIAIICSSGVLARTEVATEQALGQPIKISPSRPAVSDRLPAAQQFSLKSTRQRLTYLGTTDKTTNLFLDEDLTAFTKDRAIARPQTTPLSSEIRAEIERLTSAHYMRGPVAVSQESEATARNFTAKSLPWSADALLANPTDMNDEYISLAEYPATGNLYAVFGAKDLGGTDRDIHIAQSTDGGQSWTVWEMPAFLEDEYHPEIAIDGGGYLHVTWVRADGYILRARTTNPDAPTQWAWVKGLAVGEPCATPSIAVSGAGDFAKVFIAAGFLTLNFDYGQYEWTLIFMSSSNGGSTVNYDYFLPDGYTDLWPMWP